MTWLVEEPLYIAILGIIALAFIGFAWLQTGYRSLLHAAIGTAALTVGLLLLEYMVETEREQIESTIRRIGREVEQNRHDDVYSHVYSGAPETLATAKREFPRYKFSRVSIKRNFEVAIDQSANPLAATVTFNVRVDVKELSSGIEYHPAVFVRLTMRKEEGEWKVATYAYEDPQTGLRVHTEH